MGDQLIAKGKASHPSLRLRAEQTNTPGVPTNRCNACGQYYGDVTYHPDYPVHLPTTDPHHAGDPWLNNHVLAISTGA